MTSQPSRQQLLAELAERQGRAEELAVLNDLARRLASLHTSTDVLQEVARQARRLLGADVAYIMLRQPDDVLRIEVADGSIGSALRGIELPRGQGLGGEVLRTGRAWTTENYLDDTRFPHVERADQAAGSEQLSGILAVPLLLGDETIGLLLAADRRTRRFAEREIELLAALAAHAAVAIRNADLFDRHRAAVAELTAANQALRESNAVRQRDIEVHERLSNVVVRGGSHAELLTELGRAVGVPLGLLDAEDHRLAGTAAPDDVGRVMFPDTSPALRRTTGSVAVPVFLPDGYAGCLYASAGPELDDDTARLLEVGATSVALVLASERALAEAELRTRGEFVRTLLSVDADEASIGRRARSIGIDLDRISSLAVLDPGTGDLRSVHQLAGRLAADLNGWSAEHAGQLVLLVRRADPATVKAAVRRLGGPRLPAAIGVAACAGGVHPVRAAYGVARQTASMLHALGRSADCAEAYELGVYRSLFSQAGRDELRAFVDSTIGQLIRYDRERNAQLTPTLLAYLDQSQHHARTCAALNIHANTLYQRLDRITELLGPDWREPGRRLDLQLSGRLTTLLDHGELPHQ